MSEESHSDEIFRQVLLDLSGAAVEVREFNQLILSFCRLTRVFFHADGAYFWRLTSVDEFQGVEADGYEAARFRGTQLRARSQSHAPSIVWDAVKNRRVLVAGHGNASRDPFLASYRAATAMVVPVVAGNEVIGAVTYIHTNASCGFDQKVIAQSALLGAHLGAAIESLRLSQLSNEEHRRASILVEVAAALQTSPDTSAVLESIADRLRDLLRSPAVLVFVQNNKLFQLRAVSTEKPALAESIRARAAKNDLRSAVEIAARAVSAGERLTVNIDGYSHFSDESPPGTLIAVPFRTSLSQGAILVYPRSKGSFVQEEKTLASALAGFGAVAVANAELYGTASVQARELREMLEISGELSSVGKLDEFMRKSAMRAPGFLGFQRCFIGLLEDPVFHISCAFENGQVHPVDISLADGVAARNALQKEVFYTEDASSELGVDRHFVEAFRIKQLLVVPLIGSRGDVLGMFGVLDRIEAGPIDDEDVRRARALAVQVAVALESTRNLHEAEEHRRRAEALVALTLELNTVHHLSDFMRSFALRSAALLGARAAAITLFDMPDLKTVVMCGASEFGSDSEDKALVNRLGETLRSALARYTDDVAFVDAAELLGSSLAASFGWHDCTLVRLAGTSGEIVGVLCLCDRGAPAAPDKQLMRALAVHASIAIENARLFTGMQQTNRHWGDVVDAISDYIVVHDENHNILRVNRSLADFIGLEPEQLVGINVRALEILTAAPAPHSCPFCRTGEGLDEYLHPGLQRTYLVSTSRIRSAIPEKDAAESGKQGASQLQTVHVLKDITDRREAERKYRELFDNIQEGIYVSTPQGRFVEVNDAMVRILGYESREELLQVDIPTQLYFSPQRRQALAEQLKQTGAMRDHEETLRRKDGTPVHVYMNCYALRDAAGNAVQHRGVMLDITGLRQSQSELQKERDFSNRVLNHTQSLILVTDTEGLISYANRRWSGLGFQQSQILGRPLLELCAAARREALRLALASVARGQQVDNFDFPLIRGDGVSAQFIANMSPISGEDGRVSSVVVVLTDVTDSAVLRAKLVHAEKMAAVGQLVSGVAHEVNNPLTAILGFADLLMENPDLPQSARRDLGVILHEAQRTKQIVQNLLSFARQMPPRRQPVQLNAIIERTLQLRSYDFISHGIQVLEQLDESLPDIVGDSHQLQQVFLNILNNAYDAVRECGRSPRIEIMSTRTEFGVEVSFRDNGIGIADPDRIFDPFFTTKDVGKGTGLGLSICYGIVQEHGGDIVYHNNLDTEGATFIVRLPADKASFGAAAGVEPK